ncbi:uncharacterized protein EDB91DRAFT_1249464 [Suillus paluster]|uniref:uncharacterized protein n=1 Tax=Suillus paluster TaxID=48578 RepID=UPI001B886656|nr:uncharacterized protein EDB91DRAFT_1249464 [Suillus paluster]KAG1738146.1 hypothetical protein EDB91DRAFT_1249464 [Suillus paluster]
MTTTTHTTQNSLHTAGLLPLRQSPFDIVATFTSFSHCCTASTHGSTQSYTNLISRPHPSTPTHTHVSNDQSTTDDRDQTPNAPRVPGGSGGSVRLGGPGSPGGPPSDDEGGEPDDEPSGGSDNRFQGDDPHDLIFLGWLSILITYPNHWLP